MEDTSGFYKWNDNANEWMYGPNGVYGVITLEVHLKDTYDYPVEGWSWYDERPEDKK